MEFKLGDSGAHTTSVAEIPEAGSQRKLSLTLMVIGYIPKAGSIFDGFVGQRYSSDLCLVFLVKSRLNRSVTGNII